MMSAHDRPVWGRAPGWFSTFTARAGRSGTWPFGPRPVRGHAVGNGEDEGRVASPDPLVADPDGVPPVHAVSSAHALARIATSRTAGPRRTAGPERGRVMA